jgi:antitoxin ParD1/3/4
MNLSRPESLCSFVDAQVAERGFSTSSEYVCELIRRKQELARLRTMLLEGAASPPGRVADAAFFEGLRSRVRLAPGVDG